jgi:hypothetical protein
MTGSFGNFGKALSKIGESPCDRCESRNKCAHEALACPDYSAWMDDGRVVLVNRTPSAELYLAVFSSMDE